MTQEEKAKAYDEAIERARKINSGEGVATPPNWTICEAIFPELKESEDEKIRQLLLRFVTYDMSDNYSDDFTPADCIAWLEKQGEQKPADKVKPKFKVGDMVKYTNHHKQPIYKIVSIGKECYICESDDETLGDMAVMHFTFDNPYLRLIEQKSVWNEDDDTFFKAIIRDIENTKYISEDAKKDRIKWLKSLKDRVKPKQEWSEEDEVKINRIVACLENLNVADNDILLKDVAWLKSLRPQNTWKPSAEQMKALANALSLAKNCGEENAFDLRTLYEQLKKLREE